MDGAWLRPGAPRKKYIDDVKTVCRITYQEGKEDHQVTVLFPPDTVDALIFLCNKEVRRSAGVSIANTFVFPSTGQSDLHVGGWQALTTSCKKAGLDAKVNGTLNRHRVASIMVHLI